MKKRALSLLLALVMCMGLLPAAVFAEEGDETPDTSVTDPVETPETPEPETPSDPDFVIENGVLTRYNGDGGAVTIPDGVTSIGNSAFYDCTSLTSVTIPSGVTSIDAFAFHQCTSLKSVTIPSSVTRIGEGTFYYCTSLESVTIPSGVTRIGDNTFSCCTSLESVTIPDSVIKIGNSAFFACNNLKDIHFGGTQAQWKAITIGSSDSALYSAVIHCNGNDIDDTTTDPGKTNGDLIENARMYLWTTSYREPMDSPLSVGLYDSSNTSVYVHLDFTDGLVANRAPVIRWIVEDDSVARIYERTYEGPNQARKTVDVSINSTGLFVSDPAVVICPRKAGTTRITAQIYEIRPYSGEYDSIGEAALSFTLTVTEGNVPKITIAPQNVTLKVGEKKEITVTLSEGQFGSPWLIFPEAGAIEKLVDIPSSENSSDNRTCTLTLEGKAPGTADLNLYLSKGQGAAIPSTKKVCRVTVTGGVQSTVSFNSNGGSSVSSKTVTTGQTYGTLPTPTREGYTFDGWYTSSTGGSRVTSSTTVTATENHTLYARWIQADGKLTVSPSSVTFDKAQEGYTQPTAKTVTVKNTGDGEVTLSRPTSGDFDLGTLSKTTLAPNDSATFTVRPKAGLKPGTYSETITVKSTDGKTSAVVSISFTVEANTSEIPDIPFNDVPIWAKSAVAWAVDKKITNGTSATTFSPNNTCTRAHILTFLYRAKGEPAVTTANPFTDVKESDYYYRAAIWAAQQGLVSGNTLDPKAPCTRATVVTYLWKLAGSPASAYDNSFTDVATNAEYAQAVAWAVANGVTNGTSDTTFSPANTCTRGQIVTFLYRAYQ